MSEELQDNERVYDTEIAPRMAQIIQICQQHGIPMFATFGYGPGDWCTTAIPRAGDDGRVDLLRRTHMNSGVLLMTVTSGEGK